MDENSFDNFMNQDFSHLADWIYSLNPYEFTSMATLIALLIAPTLSINQQNSLGNFFEQIGQTFLTIAAQNQTVKHKNNQNTSNQSKNLS